jgi:hypothetical protein
MTNFPCHCGKPSVGNLEDDESFIPLCLECYDVYLTKGRLIPEEGQLISQYSKTYMPTILHTPPEI